MPTQPQRTKNSKWHQEYLQTFEVVEFSGLSLATVKRARENKELKSHQRVKRGAHLYHIDDVRKWLEGRKG